MKARLAAAQQALFLVVLASLVCGVLARPEPSNGRYLAAVSELSNFAKSYEQAAVEKSLLDYARAQGAVQLKAIQAAVVGPGVPALQLAPNAPPIQPLARVQLQSLEDVNFRAQPDSHLTIGSPQAAAIGAALAWRLARAADGAHDTSWTLLDIELAPAEVTDADLTLEQTVAQLRIDTQQAQRAVDDATKKLDAAEQLYETRRKWKLPWKILVKSDEARKEARATLEQQKRAFDETSQRYEAEAARAQHTRKTLPGGDPIPAFAVAKLKLSHAGQSSVLEIPCGLELRKVNVPPLQGGQFNAVRAAGLWDEVQNLDAAAALQAVDKHFNWHYRHRNVLGIAFGGMTVLQLLPCILPVLLFLLVTRMRSVSVSYNPFGTTVDGALPRVGFGNRVLDGLVVIVLPFAAAASAAASLLLIGQLPALPTLTAIACLVLGFHAFGKLGELQSLIEAVVRSHSNPPPQSDP